MLGKSPSQKSKECVHEVVLRLQFTHNSAGGGRSPMPGIVYRLKPSLKVVNTRLRTPAFVVATVLNAQKYMVTTTTTLRVRLVMNYHGITPVSRSVATNGQSVVLFRLCSPRSAGHAKYMNREACHIRKPFGTHRAYKPQLNFPKPEPNPHRRLLPG
jgi:hypothetical protein